MRKKSKLTVQMEHQKWQPGQSGNPGGRPRNLVATSEVRKFVQQALPEAIRIRLDLAKGATWMTAMVAGQARAATKGNPAAFEALACRLEGKVVDRLWIGREGDLEERPFDLAKLTDDELRNLKAILLKAEVPTNAKTEEQESNDGRA